MSRRARWPWPARWLSGVNGRGLPFDASGPVVVPEALVPVLCDVEQGYAAYVEPGIWVHHRLT